MVDQTEQNTLEDIFAAQNEQEISELINRMFEEEQLTLNEDDMASMVSLMTYDDLK